MVARRVETPLWVKAIVLTVAIGGPGWWLADRHDRLRNEGRLAAISSSIAGREVRVSCPGPVARAFLYETVDGSVAFDAQGRPGDAAKLREEPCAELDALAEGGRAGALACAERAPACARAEARELARAVDVLAHEAWHLHGIADEAVTECRSLQTMAWAAQQLGATEAQGHGLARLQHATTYQDMPVRYRSGGCRDGGELDMRPDDPRWP